MYGAGGAAQAAEQAKQVQRLAQDALGVEVDAGVAASALHRTGNGNVWFAAQLIIEQAGIEAGTVRPYSAQEDLRLERLMREDNLLLPILPAPNDDGRSSEHPRARSGTAIFWRSGGENAERPGARVPPGKRSRREGVARAVWTALPAEAVRRPRSPVPTGALRSQPPLRRWTASRTS